ncbi:DNA polymerase III subunit chi [Vibrio sp. 99-8-1]|uniref:DNA polymerase III subunit chi n=1 Tax=Vibrio sp. 99-8-1 TaxID=2607602 RepID=UPI001493960C|nr:DNA polymerase III subunit chi [Vibrio sp. 99-8-1]NOI65853.1 DNA polymerase III subunit chi [Vibrio sp. 99-8-1]
MNTATFYIIQADSVQCTKAGFEEYVLFLIEHFSLQGAKLYLNTEDKQQAEHWDNLIWQRPTERFLPHHLIGEGPKNGTGIEIGYSKLKPSWNRQLVINVANDKTNFAGSFNQVVDFVPCDENAKQLARERYKIYRQAGYQLQTIDINHQK